MRARRRKCCRRHDRRDWNAPPAELGERGFSQDGTPKARRFGVARGVLSIQSMKIFCYVSILATSLLGCIYANVNTPLSYRAPTLNEVKLTPGQRVQGEACNQAILGLVAWGDGGYAAAVEDAKRRSGATMLADVQADTKLFNVLFVYSKACTRVSALTAQTP